MTIPIIRLEIEHMKQSIYHALTDYTLKLDSDIKQAVDKCCTSENIQNVIATTVESSINYAISEEIETFFKHGKGRKLVKKAVIDKLNEQLIEDN